MKRILIGISYLTLLATFCLVCVIGYWILWPYKPIVFNNLPFQVENTTVKVDDLLIYDVDYCKYDSLLPTVSRTFVDSLIFLVPAEVATPKALGCHKIKASILIPKALPAGKYILKITYTYQVNPIRTFDVKVETHEFTVIK